MRTEPVETITHRGITIKVLHDDCPMNPFEDWDCEPPIRVYMGRDGYVDYGDTDPRHYLRENPDLAMTKLHAIAKALDVDVPTLMSGLNDLTIDPAYCAALPSSAWADVICEWVADNVDRDELEWRAALWCALGVPAAVYERRGYCQGDYAKVLVVLTPAWTQLVGAPRHEPDSAASIKAMGHTADLYRDWAFRDVYGYVVTDPDTGDTVDSCWGFYGSYGTKGWDCMLDEARSAASDAADACAARIAAEMEAERPDLYA